MSHNITEAEASVLTHAIIYNTSVAKQIFNTKTVKKMNQSFSLNHIWELRILVCVVYFDIRSSLKKMAVGTVCVIFPFYHGSPSACHKPDLAHTLKPNALCVDVQQHQENSQFNPAPPEINRPYIMTDSYSTLATVALCERFRAPQN